MRDIWDDTLKNIMEKHGRPHIKSQTRQYKTSYYTLYSNTYPFTLNYFGDYDRLVCLVSEIEAEIRRGE